MQKILQVHADEKPGLAQHSLKSTGNVTQPFSNKFKARCRMNQLMLTKVRPHCFYTEITNIESDHVNRNTKIFRKIKDLKTIGKVVSYSLHKTEPKVNIRKLKGTVEVFS